MITNKTTATVEGTRVQLSTLWIFALLNYLYCDVMTLMDSNFLKQFMDGKVGGSKRWRNLFPRTMKYWSRFMRRPQIPQTSR